jgi:hypothetical protein
MKAKPIPEEIKEYFSYDPGSGIIRWIKTPGRKIKIGDTAGSSVGNGYLRLVLKGKGYLCHRVAWFLYYDAQPEIVDHINGNKKDNRIINLSSGSQADNSRNQRISKNNKTGIIGVHYRKHYAYKKGKRYTYFYWVATINKTVTLKTTKDFFEACCARKSAENKYGFHENHGRIE